MEERWLPWKKGWKTSSQWDEKDCCQFRNFQNKFQTNYDQCTILPFLHCQHLFHHLHVDVHHFSYILPRDSPVPAREHPFHFWDPTSPEGKRFAIQIVSYLFVFTLQTKSVLKWTFCKKTVKNCISVSDWQKSVSLLVFRLTCWQVSPEGRRHVADLVSAVKRVPSMEHYIKQCSQTPNIQAVRPYIAVREASLAATASAFLSKEEKIIIIDVLCLKASDWWLFESASKAMLGMPSNKHHSVPQLLSYAKVENLNQTTFKTRGIEWPLCQGRARVLNGGIEWPLCQGRARVLNGGIEWPLCQGRARVLNGGIEWPLCQGRARVLNGGIEWPLCQGRARVLNGGIEWPLCQGRARVLNGGIEWPLCQGRARVFNGGIEWPLCQGRARVLNTIASEWQS